MNVLGIQYAIGSHDTSAAIVCDGLLVAAAEEERFTRRKHDCAWPRNAIEFCLRQACLEMEQVDFIAFPEKPFRSGPDSYLMEMDWTVLRKLYAIGKARKFTVIHKHLLDHLVATGLAVNWKMQPHVAGGLAELREQYSALPPIRF